MRQTTILVFIFTLTEAMGDDSWNPLLTITNGLKSFIKNPIKTAERVLSEGYNSARKMTHTFFDKKAEVKLENPEGQLSVPSIITLNGYTCETHTILSQGYLLNIHRIPGSKAHQSSKAVILQHGIFGSATDWLLNGPNKSLAYTLADAGYDVWLANVRGNWYSREHAWLDKNSEAYWNFSWHDVALHDMPVIIDYIRNLKDETRLSYIGHSMGTTILFAMLCLRPEYNDILNAGVALAPIVYLTDIDQPWKSLSSVAEKIANMEMVLGIYEFRLRKLIEFGKYSYLCDSSVHSTFCKEMIFYFCGKDENQLDNASLQMFLRHLGAGTSWKTVVHFAQEIKSGGKFQQFDYGSSDNMKSYGTEAPPEYNLTKITLPVSLFWATNDPLSRKKDVKKLYNELPPTTELYQVPYLEFNHLDYLYARDAPWLVNGKILEYLEKYNGGSSK